MLGQANSADTAQLGREWLRALRGRRSQRALSKRLGFGSNILYRWETGRCTPSASTSFRFARLCGADPDAAVADFLRGSAHRPSRSAKVSEVAGVTELLHAIRGDITLLQLSERTRFNRFTLSRWFRGVTEPRLPELFELVDATTHRLLDFISAFVDPKKLPSVEAAWRAHLTLRNAAFDAPFSHAVLHALELDEYEKLPAHEPGWIASKLGLSQNEEQRCLSLLERSGQIRMQDGRWVAQPQGTIDTGQDPKRAQQLRRFWLSEALRRFDAGVPGAFGYNLFTISDADYQALEALYAQYFESMRDLIANSTPGDRLVLFCAQLLQLSQRSERASS